VTSYRVSNFHNSAYFEFLITDLFSVIKRGPKVFDQRNNQTEIQFRELRDGGVVYRRGANWFRRGGKAERGRASRVGVVVVFPRRMSVFRGVVSMGQTHTRTRPPGACVVRPGQATFKDSLVHGDRLQS
jgi:hypothetical protein